MNQGTSTAKNLRDLLLKQQQNAKIKFKGDPNPKPQQQPSNIWSITSNQSQQKKQPNNITPMLYIGKKSTPSVQTSKLSNSMLKQQEIASASRSKKTNSNSISAHQSPMRVSDKQLVLQQLFLQKQIIKKQEPEQQQQPKPNVSKPQFYQHMENYLNNYYSKGSNLNKINQTKKSEVQKSINQLSSTQTSFKVKKNLKGSESQIPIQAESAPVSPKGEKKRNKSIYEISEKTQQISHNKYEPVNKGHFKFLYVIGKGGFGRVWKVEMKKNRKLYAMKEMSKAKIIQKRSVNSVLNERYLLEHLYHPFLVNMSYSFYDRDNLFLAIDLLTGGDLRFHLGKMRRFSENQTKFFVACILLPLTYLHQNGIIHRDLKPENLVLDDEGYMRLTDLGIARISKGNNAGDTSGTPGYMAPEVMCKMDHSIVADYYALGVITYELMLGKRPYNGRSRQEIREQILAKQVQVRREEIPPGWSDNAIDFINRLIQRKPEKRLGSNGLEEIFAHPWLKTYPWEQLLNRQIKALYVPGSVDDNFDFQNQISEETQLNEEQVNENQLLLRRPTVQALFDGYTFDPNIQRLQHQQTQKNSQRSN